MKLFDESLRTFEMFSLSHFLVILFVIGVIVAMYIFKNKLKESPRFDFLFRNGLAYTMLLLEYVFILWSLAKGGATLDLLPFGLCAISMYMTSIMLIKNSEKIFRVIFPWAITGAILSLIVADMNYEFPHFRFFHYFFNHAFFLIGNIYFVVVKEYKLQYKHVLISSSVLTMIAIILYNVNQVLGTNYMFLSQLPSEVEGMFAWMGDKFWVWGFGIGIFILFNLWYVLFFKLSDIKLYFAKKAYE